MLIVLWLACARVDSDSDTDVGPVDDRVTFGFPLPERDRFTRRIGVDHDPVVQDGSLLGRATCTDYLGRGFPNCYDEHHGSDYPLEGGFDAMDAGSATIVAAAAGTVVEIEDGHYDHCHGDMTTGEVSCDGHEKIGNHVIIEHADGLRTLYWHLETGSVAVGVGDVVACGQPLGLVGSSGESSFPHLHFEVNDASGAVIDPYAGPYSQDLSYWTDQGVTDALPGAGCAASP